MLSRRNWLKFTTSSTLLPGIGWLTIPRRARMRLVPITDLERETVSRVVGLLIPADETPGAVELGIDRTVLQEIEANHWNARWVAEAVLWLDAQAKTDGVDRFLTLDDGRQIALLERMEAAPLDSAPGRVFRLLRHSAMIEYYGLPETWPSLGFDGPPQPAGFPGYAGPPAAPRA